MLLGEVTAPLAFEEDAEEALQQQVLELAMEWLKEGKLQRPRYHTPAMAGPSSGGSFLWLHEKVELPAASIAGSAVGTQLVLYVADEGFIKFVLGKLPSAATLVVSLSIHTLPGGKHRALRLANTQPFGPLERIARYFAERDMRSLNESVRGGIRMNVRLYGPGLDERDGMVLKLDVRDENPYLYGDAGPMASSDGDGAKPVDGGSNGDEEEDEEDEEEANGDGGSAVSGRRVLGACRKRSRANKGNASSGAQGTGNAAGKAKAQAAPKQPQAATRARKRAKRNPVSESTPAMAATAAAAATVPAKAEAALKPAGMQKRAPLPDSTGSAPALAAPRPVCPVARDGRWHLGLEFVLEEEALDPTALNIDGINTHPPAEARGRMGATRGRDAGKKGLPEMLTVVMHVLLEYGTGLYIGPDCDGALNTGDAYTAGEAPPAAAATSSGAAAADGTAATGASASAAVAGPARNGEGAEAARNLDAILDSIQPADLPQALPPAAVVTHPKPFQLQGLEWMLRRERRGDAVGRSLLLLHPAWAQVVVGSSGLVLHVHRLAPHRVTPEFIPTPVGGTCGGFLCDEMGLGKSLQTLMLIVSNPPPAGWPAKPVPISAGSSSSGDAGAAAAAARPSRAPPVTALTEPPNGEPVPIATTLLVTPANLLNQWVEEIERHLQPGTLRWAVYKGREQSAELSARLGVAAATKAAAAAGASTEPDKEEEQALAGRRGTRALRQLASATPAHKTKLLPPALATGERGVALPVHSCDVVLVSYEVLRRELAMRHSSASSQLLPRLGFWRIVLDEAQLVANSNSVAAQVVSSLYRRHAWVVTGTPVSSSLGEVQGLCEFLSYEPYYHSQMWRNLVLLPYTQRTAIGPAVFRALLRGVMLRRTKSQVESQLALPPCLRVDINVNLAGVERAFYDVLKKRYLEALEPLRAGAGGPGGLAAGGAGPSGSGPAPRPARNGGAAGRSAAQLREERQRRASEREKEKEDRRPNAAYHRATAALVALRQSCCHPHIVRREADSGGQAGKGGKGGKASGGRRSMRQIMAKLVSDAYASFDQAVGLLFAARIQAAALREYQGAAGDVDGSAAPGAAAGGAEGPVAALQRTARLTADLVGATDLAAQARARGADGTIIQDRARETEGLSGRNAGSGGLAGTAQEEAEEQARDRRRRWQRLDLDCSLLRLYIACLKSPPGTLSLLAARASLRTAVEAQVNAMARSSRAAEDASRRSRAVMPLVTAATAAMAGWRARGGDERVAAAAAAAVAAATERKRKRAAAAGGAAGGAAATTAGDAEDDGAEDGVGAGEKDKGWEVKLDAGLRQLLTDLKAALSAARGEARAAARAAVEADWAADGGAGGPAAMRAVGNKAADKAVEACEPELTRALTAFAAAARLMVEAKEAARSAAEAEATVKEVAVAEAAAADTEEASASADVRAAADRVQALQDELNAVRLKLGMEPVDLLLAEAELRRGSRRQGGPGVGGGAAAAGAGGSRPGGSRLSGAGRPGRIRQRSARRRYSDSSESSEWSSSESDDSDVSTDDMGTFGRKGPKRSRGSGAEGGLNDDASKPRTPGAAAGLLQALGATAFQEAQFRAEPVIRTFQHLTSRAASQKAATAPGGAAAAAGAAARDPGAAGAADGSEADESRLQAHVREKWAALRHLLNQQEELGLTQPVAIPGMAPPDPAGPSGSAPAGAETSGSEPGCSGGRNPGSGATGSATGAAAPPDESVAAATAQEEFSCPICLDASDRRTVTTCGHTYCTDCIHDIVQAAPFAPHAASLSAQSKGSAPCPICRRRLTREDLMDSVSEAEALLIDAEVTYGADEYGAKVSALLEELRRMSSEDPGSKALVFSSWGRLLRLVQEALVSNGVRCASMVGGDPTARSAALSEFLHDPECRVLLLLKSTSGGAAGLTLTVAHTAFMMEPAVNPGLEAQAAARICRLGQDRPTRVVRIIATDTVEERVLALQRHKQQNGEVLAPAAAATAPGARNAGGAGAGGGGGTADNATEAVDSTVLLRFFDKL
ncbi:hypothetical protein GPECTOR_5g465 [Gonium pectorale]|uniref:RING-type domain-containing protein n=1 Tax=Gonium pectorale TaxID=33097 RepID=A0A150GWX6_GONPE|nr:hypothetical protein GPECTOR_5g465 [Gonium pectorale]|eukprot:KXZ54387.1 hypothetical protein GPECTOR_5g465 [Gonium pectorale]